ncbi:hypothetical protein [Mesorhizobium sp. M0254]|uniref:hypothetical protein n=1 Tax=Mesorhizobium sp. M0254 TaxID=2956927 RepID=UPI003334F38D
MGFEADRMFNLILNDDDIETERNVILEERRWRRERTLRSGGRGGQRDVAANQPYRIRVNGWRQEMEKLNGTDAFTISNEYRTTPCWWWPATQSLRR